MLVRCISSDSVHVALQVQGPGSKAPAKECMFERSAAAAISVSTGAAVVPVGCTLASSDTGLIGTAGGRSTAKRTHVEGNHDSNVALGTAATADLSNCIISGCVCRNGVLVKCTGTKATAKDCRIQSDTMCGVVASLGGLLELLGGSLKGGVAYSAFAEGTGSWVMICLSTALDKRMLLCWGARCCSRN